MIRLPYEEAIKDPRRPLTSPKEKRIGGWMRGVPADFKELLSSIQLVESLKGAVPASYNLVRADKVWKVCQLVSFVVGEKQWWLPSLLYYFLLKFRGAGFLV